MTAATDDARARETARGWFCGREDLFAAVETVACHACIGWLSIALAPATRRGRPHGFGCADAEDLRARAVAAGYEVLSHFAGPDRDEVAPATERVRLLRALALLEAVDTDEPIGGGR